ncbi:MAG: nucleotidyl transferase AbiEii/AbiGii toxin family protein [Acidobacteria bacterium]|nr:nucleotidyl transferase AbiEii/AbiGii toxin family protein [Acidobacteriota bacterium]
MTSNVAASIKARLLAQAKARGEEFELTLVRFATERLLFRLGESAGRRRCVLKGAALLAAWLPDPYRATRDVDVLASGPSDDSAIRSLMHEICSETCPEDGLRFDLSDLVVETLRANEEYSGKRAQFRAYLGKARIPLQVDLGFGDALAMPPQEIEYPTMLKTLPKPRLRAYPREGSVAEKFHAMVELGTQNSRMKDFHDVWALAGAFEFKGPSLRKAIAACFERRETPWTAETPSALTTTFYQNPELETRWRRYCTASTVLSPPPAQFEVIGERIIRFLGPVRDSFLHGTAFGFSWTPGEAWVTAEEENPA